MVLPHPASALDAALRSLLTAHREANRAAQAGSCIALTRAVRALDGTCRRYGVPAADLDDVRQELLLKIVRSLRALHGDLRSPRAWARRVARSVAVDWVRRERRARREDLDLDCIAAPLEEPELEPDRSALLEQAVTEYVARADLLPRGPRGHHVRAWYELRIRALPAVEVAGHLARGRSDGPAFALIWKWAERGQGVVLRLADADEDPARADLMRRVVGARALPKRPEPAQPGTGRAEHRDLFFYAFIAGLSARKSPEALLGVRRFARAVPGEGPLHPVALRGAGFVALLAENDPIPARGRTVGTMARRLLASAEECQRGDGAGVSPT